LPVGQGERFSERKKSSLSTTAFDHAVLRLKDRAVSMSTAKKYFVRTESADRRW
jgi:hypothetical protein